MAKDNFNVRISLTEKQVAALCGGDNPTDKSMESIQAVAQTCLSRLADGGVLFYKTHRDQIERVLGPVDDVQQIVEAIEDGASMEGDNVVVSVVIDPIFVSELDEKAVVTGMNRDVLLSDLFTTALHTGMFYDMQTERIPILLTPEQHEAIKNRLEIREDAPLTGDALARKLGWKEAEEDLFAADAVEEGVSA